MRISIRLLSTIPALLLCSSSLSGDDRDLLRTSSGNPYVFVLFDTSGSMNWTPRCTAAQVSAGICDYLCPTGDCLPPRSMDDPASKFFQAKSALHEVIRQTPDVNWGFATYDQDGLWVRAKHWLYRTTNAGPLLAGGERFPLAGQDLTYGWQWACDQGSGNNEIGCTTGNPADTSDAWDVERVRRHPKLGDGGTTDTLYYVRRSGTTYRILFENIGGEAYGAPTFASRVTSWRCNNGSCSSRTQVDSVVLNHTLVGDFLSWDNGASRTQPWGFFSQGAAGDPDAGGTCDGWDSNTDSSNDIYSGTNLKWTSWNTNDSREPTASSNYFTYGDVIPLDWQSDNRQLLLDRLSPNGVDFGVAPYFENTPSGGELQLRSGSQRPLVAEGSTPLGESLRDFRGWYSGWSDVAARLDRDWSCRQRYVLVLTDGDDTCSGSNGDPCSNATALRNLGFLTYVVAFGVEDNNDNTLDCLAQNGGTGRPIYPQNREELVDALTQIFGSIQEETRAFASAAVPSVQADVSDKIYISRFVPLNDEPVWPGSLDGYVKPLLLNDDGSPRIYLDPADGTLPPGHVNPPLCSEEPSGCYLWDVGKVLFDQAPSPTEIAATNYKIGPNANQRRVFYPTEFEGSGIPGVLRPFTPPAGATNTCPGYPLLSGCSAWWDLFYGLGLDALANPLAARNTTVQIIGQTLVQKEVTREVPDTSTTDPNDTRTVTYEFVLGDLFHSDPLYVERPNDFDLYRSDNGNPLTSVNPGYREFVDKHRFRRKMLAIGSNDGQLHFFDAGRYESDRDGSRGDFNLGSGTELFAIAPRMALPIIRDLATGDEQIYAMDGSARVGDVYIDPRHSGTPDPDDREWRTVVIAGMREGGNKFPSRDYVEPRAWKADDVTSYRRKAGYSLSGYIAVDVTQPDQLRDGNEPRDVLIPDCLRLDGSIPADCGPNPFPAVLWEFHDESPATGLPFDEDQNGRADLADTWSAPVIRQVRTNTGRHQVAIFGGGMDSREKLGQAGNWLYMVDVETGQAIYKRPVVGAIATNITVQDRDNDSFMDTLYFGTTAGLIYKVDLRLTAAETVEAVTVNNLRDVTGAATSGVRITGASWDPFPIFRTGPAGSSGSDYPVYYSPTAFYLAQTGEFALAFGTGDRENLWTDDDVEARFYVIKDRGWTRSEYLSGSLPLTETDLMFVAEADGATSSDFVTPPTEQGWFFVLEPNERVITPALGLVGLLNFTSFNPVTEVVADDGENFCARTGASRLFVVDATNGNGLLTIDDQVKRYDTIADFTTPPFLEQAQTANQAPGTPPPPVQDRGQVAEKIKEMFPETARFANYYYRLVQRTSRNVVIDPIIIPIGITVSNWKEF
jgi:hypothetical protein